MDPLILVIIFGLVAVLSSGLTVISSYRSSKKRYMRLRAEAEKAEAELLRAMKEVDLSELTRTEAGTELLNMLQQVPASGFKEAENLKGSFWKFSSPNKSQQSDSYLFESFKRVSGEERKRILQDLRANADVFSLVDAISKEKKVGETDREKLRVLANELAEKMSKLSYGHASQWEYKTYMPLFVKNPQNLNDHRQRPRT